MDMVFSQLPFRLLAILIFLVGPTCALQTDLTLTYSNASYPGLQGSTATFVCSWSFDPQVEVASQLTFSSTNRQIIYTFFIGNQFNTNAVTNEGFIQNRMTVAAEGLEDGSVTLILSQLECSDEGTYKCVYAYSRNSQSQPNAEEEKELVIRVPPSAPTLTPSVDLTAGVLEGGGMDLTCTANVGSKNKGRIRWRIYRTDVRENIANTDSRIQVNAVTQDCADTVTSTLSLQGLTRQDQNLVAACFVSNDDFSETLDLPVVCENQGLCDQTETVYVYYSVSESTITVTHDPQEVYHGGSVTLSCKAEGYPEPTIVWMKGNETMNGERGEFGVSRLVLTNLTVDGDSGIYMCVASNDVQGNVVTVNKTINITVSPTSPPPTEPPTEPTTSTTPGDNNTQKSTSGGGDDNTVIIIVVVIVVLVVVIAAVVGVILYKKRTAQKSVEDPPAKPVNNANFNHAFVQPDLVADEKIRTPSLNNSFDVKNEDGLMYADLTYDNRPRSRKPLALGDNASDYSDIQMPHV